MWSAWKLASRKMKNIKLEDLKAYAKHFNEESFQGKLRAVAGLVGENILLPVLQAYYVLRSPGTPTRKKLYIMGALGYFILPTDFIPDFIPFLLGFSDDLVVIGIILKNVSDVMTPEIEEKALETYNRLTTFSHKKTKQDSL